MVALDNRITGVEGNLEHLEENPHIQMRAEGCERTLESRWLGWVRIAFRFAREPA